MADDISLNDVTDAVAAKPAPAPAPVAVKAPANGIEKPLNEEFFLDTDFAQIAEGLGLEIDQVEFSLTTGETSHTLSGVAK